MFTRAIVKKPCRQMIYGITHAGSGIPDYDSALAQHEAYIKALKECGLTVYVLDGSPDFPDSVFVEDTAVLIPQCAIVANPGSESRKGETDSVKKALMSHYFKIEQITEPGTLDGGDIMMADGHCYIGISERTNREGAKQLRNILDEYGVSSTDVCVEKALHLKTAVNYLGNNTIIASGEFIDNPIFANFNRIFVDDQESYAANSLLINNTVLVPEGYPSVLSCIRSAGYNTISLNISEFRKLNGGLSCLSLRF